MDDPERWALLHQKAQEFRIAAAFRLLRSEKIEPILIKGWAAGRFYPPGKIRVFGDIDLAVSPADFVKARQIAASRDGAVLNIDLHRGLRHFDIRPWQDIFCASETFEACETPIRVLSAEDNLRLLCGHWLNDGGADRDRLWDIYYAVDNRPARFDWDDCLNAAGPERRSWVVCGVGVAHKYLGLPISTLPFRPEAEHLPEWVCETIEVEWASGERLRDLRTCLRDPRIFLSQIRKRVPPNPIQATIEMQKSLSGRGRKYFQIRTMLRRALRSLAKFRYVKRVSH